MHSFLIHTIFYPTQNEWDLTYETKTHFSLFSFSNPLEHISTAKKRGFWAGKIGSTLDSGQWTGNGANQKTRI